MPPKKKIKHMHEATVATPTRRSTRNVEKAERSMIASEVRALVEADSNPSNPNHDEPVLKCFRGLRDMPFDILFEIFHALSPGDLLNLARTSKDLRQFLMSHEASIYWEQAMKQVRGLPVRPAHLSEPAYVNLIYSNHCHNCLEEKDDVKPYWPLFLRYCEECVEFMFVFNCDHITAPMGLLVSNNPMTYFNSVQLQTSGKYKWAFHRPELDDVSKRWKTLKSKAEKALYLDERSKFVTECSGYEQQFRQWEQVLKKNEIYNEHELFRQRHNAILAQLRKEGWGDELNHMQAEHHKRMSFLNVENRSRKLTDKEWGTIRGPFVKLMKDVRAGRQAGTIMARLRHLKATLYAHQCSVLTSSKNAKDRLYAGVADIALVPEVRAIIEDHSTDVSEEAIKAKLTAIVPELADRWVDERRAEFTARLCEGLGDSQAGRAPVPLELAIASFTCLRCINNRGWYNSEPPPPWFGWPDVAEHGCFRYSDMGNVTGFRGDYYMGHVSTLVKHYPNDLPFTGVKSVYILEDRTDFRDVIEVCGQDPDTVTYDQMQQCEIRLRCRLCASYARQEVFDWIAAIRHDFEAHPWLKKNGMRRPRVHVQGRWERISDEHARQAKALETALTLKLRGPDIRAQDIPDHFRCGWCAFHSGYESVLRHLWHDHGVGKHNEVVHGQDLHGVRSKPLTTWMYSETLSNCLSLQDDVAAGRAFFATF
ncbi:hypothetical protein C8Q80DRAFT_1345957 [Daedaleopsis nitida]|nr:hypothetical protein C8Q80DRAFT_1345957 [Daedaleopsis nitida]